MTTGFLTMLIIALLIYPALQCAYGLAWLLRRRRLPGDRLHG